jgi:cystine transport system permease protein
MSSFFDWSLVGQSLVPLAQGMVLGTIPLTIISFSIGLVLALVTALARLSPVAAFRLPAAAYISAIRGTPLLLQLFIIFFGLPSIGIVLDPWPSAIVAFSVNVGAYAAETIRGAIIAVPESQWEAATSIGLTRNQALRFIILPQAAKAAIPSLSNSLISLVKDTSLASVVLVTDLLRKAQEIAAPTYQFFLLYMVAAVYYWIVCELLNFGQRKLEKRVSWKAAA